ncbi:Glycosyltransferase [Hyella patelloides LEGE 07179]|uniref:Glycosyltransferase n=1 Tax=Hyella patelloides LEGE 07179 TaxID=945734 RepID=A0A563VU05_9CYAN|nr:glycosyltransferase family 4 protein [Hyella patelloides]VEP14751.1 Glycosyltransferase [Hyella patelloides LEGE 07179]
MNSPQRTLLFISTPVGALGTGQGGGVELTVQNVAQELQQRGHQIEVVAPTGSVLKGIRVTEIAGELQIAVQTQGRNVPIYMPENPALANMWEYARQVQDNYDLIVNFAFDWLPFYLTPFFRTKVAHFISMGSMTEALDAVMNQIAEKYPNCIGVYTKSQAETFPFANKCEILSSAIDLSLYNFCDTPGDSMAWLGRIAPEKALEDAVTAASITGIPLKIYGKIQDRAYWQKIQQDFPDAPIEYMGFLSTEELQQELGKSRALIMTPRWIEAFGNVAIEALACGVPVIAYRRGGPSEIVRDGKTGFLVQPDSINDLVTAMKNIDTIERIDCRQQAETEYSLTVLGDNFEAWFDKILG